MPVSTVHPVRKSLVWKLFLSWIQKGLLFLAILHLGYQVGPIYLSRVRDAPGKGHDMDIYYRAALRLQRGEDVYQPWPEYEPRLIPDRFFYSPPFLLLTRPLVALGYRGFSAVWMAMIIAAYWVYAACLARLATGTWNWRATLVFSLIISTIFNGDSALLVCQFEPCIWMMFGLALTTRCRAGWLSLATLVKIHPLWSLCLVLRQEKTAALKQAARWVLPIALLSLILVGPRNWMMWWPATQPVASQGTFSPFNWSVPFYALRLAEHAQWLSHDGPLPAWARAFLSLCAVATPLATAFLTRWLSRELQLSLVASAGVLFAPLCWMIYTPILLLPVAVWWGERFQGQTANRFELRI